MRDEQFLTVEQVAGELQVTAQTVRNLIAQGKLPARRVGRPFRVLRKDLDALITGSKVTGAVKTERRDVWATDAVVLPVRRRASVWDGGSAPAPLKRRAVGEGGS